jgi:hypothetical protein
MHMYACPRQAQSKIVARREEDEAVGRMDVGRRDREGLFVPHVSSSIGVMLPMALPVLVTRRPTIVRGPPRSEPRRELDVVNTSGQAETVERLADLRAIVVARSIEKPRGTPNRSAC